MSKPDSGLKKCSPMDNSKNIARKTYGNRLRLRVCGLCVRNESLLLVRHRGLGPAGELWSLPGGGQEFGETTAETLRREFREETGLHVNCGPLLFVCEYLEPPLHALEMYFEARPEDQNPPQTGYDPETPGREALLSDCRFFSAEELRLIPREKKHFILRKFPTLQDLRRAQGYFLEKVENPDR